VGLDTYASRAPDSATLTEEDGRAFDEARLTLCGGMFSGEGGSFRGKVYVDAVEHVSGVSLYQEWIPPETVREMAEDFERCDPEAVERELAGQHYETTADEIRELRRFFRICADRGLGLVGWW
jgi:hypothetical protein